MSIASKGYEVNYILMQEYSLLFSVLLKIRYAHGIVVGKTLPTFQRSIDSEL